MRITNFICRALFLLMLMLGTTRSMCAASWEPTLNQVSWKGDVKRLILLVETADRPFYTPNANNEYDQMLNGDNYTGLGCVGSAGQFLKDNSGGKFRPQFIVVGPLRLSKSMGYYGGKPAAGESNDGDMGKMVIEACRMAKELHKINFAEFDYNNDEKVDNVYLFHSGPIDTTIPTPWPHASGVAGGGLIYDGKLIDSYAVSQEMATETVRGAYSTFLHEFGHTLGLTDDYSGRLGKFSIYCDGTFDGGVIPVNFNAMERLLLGWLDYQVIDADGQYTLEPLAKNKALMLKTNNPDEYFLFENRSNSKSITPWDSFFEYDGMLIWHIDRSQNKITLTGDNGPYTMTALQLWGNNSPNASPSHPCHELIEADNINSPGQYRSGMYFPGSRYETSLSSATNAEFKTWAGLPLGVEISNIKQESNGNITLTVKKTNSSSLAVSVKNSNNKSLSNSYVSLTPIKESYRSKLLGGSFAASGAKITGETGLNGICIFPDIPTGKYQLLVDKQEYAIYSDYIDVVEGDNAKEVIVQSQEQVEGTSLRWHADENYGAVFFVPNQIRCVGWDATDLSPYIGQKLDKVNIQLGGEGNTGDLYVFIDDQIVYSKPMEKITVNGITTIDLSAENILIEAGKTLRTGYHLKTASEWPSTRTTPQTPNKGGLIYAMDSKEWCMINDLGINWVISIVLRDGRSIPIESITFDDQQVELSVGEQKNLYANVRPMNVINRKVTWDSSDKSVATIDENGKVKAIAVGSTTITATSVQSPTISGTCIINVRMSSEMVTITPHQRSAKVSWPNNVAQQQWKVTWREKGAEQYTSLPAKTGSSAYITGLKPETNYQATLEAVDNQSTPIEFEFTTLALSSEFAIITINKNHFQVGETIPLIVSNISDDNHSIVWKINRSKVDDHEYTFTKDGKYELRAEIALSDDSTEVVVKELTITK